MLPEQVPSDPDEPFFILSLTEIPVYSMGEMGGSTAEPLPGVPVTELSVQNQRLVPTFCLCVLGSGFVECFVYNYSHISAFLKMFW